MLFSPTRYYEISRAISGTVPFVLLALADEQPSTFDQTSHTSFHQNRLPSAVGEINVGNWFSFQHDLKGFEVTGGFQVVDDIFLSLHPVECIANESALLGG